MHAQVASCVTPHADPDPDPITHPDPKSRVNLVNEISNNENLPSDQTDPSGSNGDGLKGQFWLLYLEIAGLILFGWLFTIIF